MTTIETLIQSIDDWESKTPQQLVAALNEPFETISDRVWTVQGLIDALSMETAGLVIGTLEAAGSVNPLFKTAFLTLSVVGLELGSQARQSMIETLGQVAPMVGVDQWTPQLTAALKRLGRPLSSLWMEAGRSGVATLDDVEDALDAIDLESRKQALKQAGAARWNAFADAVDNWDGLGQEPTL